VGSDNLSDKVYELRGTLTLSDLVRFQYFNFLRRTWWFVIVVMLILLAGVILAAVLAFVFHDYKTASTNGIPILLVFLFWCAALTVLPYAGARKQLRTNASIREPFVYTFSPEGIHFRNAFISGETSWNAFWRICETKSLFCLYPGAGAAWVLPKRFFKDDAEQNGWRRLVEEKIAPKKIMRPGFVGRRI